MEQPEGKGRLLLGDDVIGGRVLNDRGETSSPLADIEFDMPTGHITELILIDSTTIPGLDLLGSGSFATVAGVNEVWVDNEGDPPEACPAPLPPVPTFILWPFGSMVTGCRVSVRS
jgi:sporulation protein YlmC with PRC-barrel domain